MKSHPPSPRESCEAIDRSIHKHDFEPPPEPLSREAIRFLADVATRPLSTTVSRYQRLHLSRRRGNAIRRDLLSDGMIEAAPIATRSGQVVLYQLTDHGRAVASSVGIDPGPSPRASLEHTFWAHKVARSFGQNGYEVAFEHAVPGDGFVDVVAERPGERVAIKIETGKSDIEGNLAKLRSVGFDRVAIVAASPSAVTACQRAIQAADSGAAPAVELMTWLDVS